MGLLNKVMSFFSKKEDANQYYNQLKLKARTYIGSDNDKAMNCVKLASTLAWRSRCSYMHDKDIDSLLSEIVAKNASDASTEKDAEIVIVTSGILEFGGLSQQVLNLVRYLSSTNKLSLWTTESFSNSDPNCKRAEDIRAHAEINIVDKASHLDEALQIVAWVESRAISSFLYFLSPDDVTANILPALLPGHNHIFVNVSHHVFSLGSIQFDSIIDVSDFYYNLSHTQQRNDNIDLIYLSGREEYSAGNDEDEKNVKASFRKSMGIPDDALVTLTIGNPNKNIWANDNSYIDIIGEMLLKYPKVHHVLLANGMNKIRSMILTKYFEVKGRIHALDSSPDLANVMRSCDLYLNSYPMGGALSSLDAILFGLPIVAIPAQADWFKIPEITAFDKADYLAIIKNYIEDASFRDEQYEKLREFYISNHNPSYIAEQYKFLIDSTTLSTISDYPSQDFIIHDLNEHIDKDKLFKDLIKAMDENDL